MEIFWNIAMIFFALSGIAGWLLILICGWFYWMCKTPHKEEL